MTVEDQVAKDKYGRRRFHGAFTGGFSAGFFNTVGSLEGWKPSQFKSSRQVKAQSQVQKAEDYMDDEVSRPMYLLFVFLYFTFTLQILIKTIYWENIAYCLMLHMFTYYLCHYMLSNVYQNIMM